MSQTAGKNIFNIFGLKNNETFIILVRIYLKQSGGSKTFFKFSYKFQKYIYPC